MEINLDAIQQLSGDELEKKIEELGVKCLTEGISPGAVAGYSEEEINAVYNIAYNLYQQYKFQDAKNLFSFLTLYEGLDKRYWIGLGGCYQMLKEYDKAVIAYTAAAYMDPSDPTAAFHAGECYAAQEDWEQVRKVVIALKSIKNLNMDESAQYETIFNRMQMMEQNIPA